MTLQPFAVVFPDAELTATGKMRTLLAAHGETGVHVDRKVPDPRADRMVILTRDGGASDVLDHPRLRVRVWALTDAEVTRLAHKVLALAALMADGDPITRCAVLSGPYEVPDASGQPQRYALLELATKGVALS